MIKEIGSTFFLDPTILDVLPKMSVKRPNILGGKERYVSTCRSAIGTCLDTLAVKRKVAMVPAFTCKSVLGPFLKRGYEVFPYPIGRDLLIHWERFKAKVDEVNPSVILTHPYFGFNSTEELREHVLELRSCDIILIEDMTQSMFSEFEPMQTNFHVGSIRKWIPVPDGAFTTAPVSCTEEDSELAAAKLKALIEKGDFILNGNGDKAEFRKDFGIAEGILDSRERVYKMSSAAREIYSRTDISWLKDTRWGNYLYLELKFANDPVLCEKMNVIFTKAVAGVCPFHFSVLVNEGRKELQQYLASNDIYATVIWGCPKEFENLIDDNARYIYDHILCFHVDQRYDVNDMERIYKTLKDYYTEK